MFLIIVIFKTLTSIFSDKLLQAALIGSSYRLQETVDLENVSSSVNRQHKASDPTASQKYGLESEQAQGNESSQQLNETAKDDSLSVQRILGTSGFTLQRRTSFQSTAAKLRNKAAAEKMQNQIKNQQQALATLASPRDQEDNVADDSNADIS